MSDAGVGDQSKAFFRDRLVLQESGNGCFFTVVFFVGVVLLPVATFGSHLCTRFLSFSVPQGPKSRSKKAHERFGKYLTSKSPSQSDIFCKLRCNNLPEESNPVRDTGSIRGKDLWQMATKQTANGEFKQFVLRMITARLGRSLVGGNLYRVHNLQACQSKDRA
jgi:hypothetical protein